MIDHYQADKSNDARWIGGVSQSPLKGIIAGPVLIANWTLPMAGLTLEKLASKVMESLVVRRDDVVTLEFLRLPQEVESEGLEARPFFVF